VPQRTGEQRSLTNVPSIHDLPTPSLIVDADALEHNLATMAALRPGSLLRPHVKAHKCTSLAAEQMRHGHRSFTCATPREVLGMVEAGLGHDLLLANESVNPWRLAAMAFVQDEARITIAVDSEVTIDAAAKAGIREVLIDVNIGLPRCGCPPDQAARLADYARAKGLTVRGVMGYEGHLMMELDHQTQRAKVNAAVDLLMAAHVAVGGELVSSGGTGTYHLHDRVDEVQAGSYALMDTQYMTRDQPFRQALYLWATVIAVTPAWAVCDAGLKSLAMDHGNPTIADAAVWFCSDEHVTFAPAAGTGSLRVGQGIAVTPAHVDPTVAMHEFLHIVRGEDIVDSWPIDLRGW
jgi:D-threonine aldolase